MRCFTSTPKILSGFQRRDWAIVREQEVRVAGDFDACWGDVVTTQYEESRKFVVDYERACLSYIIMRLHVKKPKSREIKSRDCLGSEASFVEMLNAGPPTPSSSEDGKSVYERSLRAMSLETAQLDETCDWGRCSVEF